jgi:murein L,D-transpeptidase YafK
MTLEVARLRAFVKVLAIAGAALTVFSAAAQALSIELKDVAADRVERQIAAAAGALPLPNTPNVADFSERLKDKGVRLSSPIIIRIFKSESELEVWKEKGDTYVHFATYPICHWSGSVGPKMRDGDKQAPEGFYTVTRAQTRHQGRWPKSLNIGFPNILDQSLARTGSNILIHGGCSSVGCFAMTNPVMDEIQNLAEAALDGGQDHVPVQVYPFRLTDANMKANAASPWFDFWTNMKEGYDAFEKAHRPVAVSVCEGRYSFEPVSRASDAGSLKACAPTMSGLQEQDRWLRDVPEPEPPTAEMLKPKVPQTEEDTFIPRFHLPLADAESAPPG